MRVTLRILLALTFTATVFLVGLYLPLSLCYFFRGDPGMPAGAGLVLMGFPLGVTGAVVAGLFSFIKLRGKTAYNTSVSERGR